MTDHDEARRRAVEAAKTTWIDTAGDVEAWDEAIAACERAMADAGWRWVRDCGEAVSANPGMARTDAYAAGWNDARAAMLGEGE